jgi:hypothetical protein
LSCSENPIDQDPNLEYNGDVIVDTLMKEEFLQDFYNKGYEVINGNLRIHQADGVNLNLLNNVRIVTETVQIKDSLSSIDFLDKLSLAGNVYITYSTSLKGHIFNNLSKIKGNLSLGPDIFYFPGYDPELPETVIEFPKLDTVGGQVSLGFGLSAKKCLFTSLKYAHSIFFQDGLADSIDFLPSLQKVGKIELRSRNLVNIDGLSGLIEADTIKLWGCEKLKSIQGLNSIKECKELTLFANFELESLNGIENLKKITEKLYIVSNLSLTDYCSLNPNAIQSLVSMDNAIVIYDNGYNPSYQMLIDGQCSNQ